MTCQGPRGLPWPLQHQVSPRTVPREFSRDRRMTCQGPRSTLDTEAVLEPALVARVTLMSHQVNNLKQNLFRRIQMLRIWMWMLLKLQLSQQLLQGKLKLLLLPRNPQLNLQKLLLLS